VTTLPEAKLDAVLARHAMVEAELSRQLAPETFVKLSRELAEITPVAERVKAYRAVVAELGGLDAMLGDPDPDMRAIAAAEKPQLEARCAALAQDIRLLPNVFLFGDFARLQRKLQFQQPPLAGRGIRILLLGHLRQCLQNEFDAQNRQRNQIVDQEHSPLLRYEAVTRSSFRRMFTKL